MQEKAVFRSWLFSVKYYIQMNIFGLNKILNHLGFEKRNCSFFIIFGQFIEQTVYRKSILQINN